MTVMVYLAMIIVTINQKSFITSLHSALTTTANYLNRRALFYTSLKDFRFNQVSSARNNCECQVCYSQFRLLFPLQVFHRKEVAGTMRSGKLMLEYLATGFAKSFVSYEAKGYLTWGSCLSDLRA